VQPSRRLHFQGSRQSAVGCLLFGKHVEEADQALGGVGVEVVGVGGHVGQGGQAVGVQVHVLHTERLHQSVVH
jgi:hypothetical protein